MTLDSAQAKAMAAQPRLNPLERDELINLLAEGKSNTELAVQFNKAPGTIANFKSRNKGEIAEVQRRRTVQFEDLWITRKQARLDHLEQLFTLVWDQIRMLRCLVL
jgi:IS30 family transposase